MTDEERRLLAKQAAHASWARTTDRSERTAAARKAFEETFVAMAGGDPVRAEQYRAAHYAKLALQSAQARRKARQELERAAAAEAELAAMESSL
jgi:hypothetical protein